MKTLSITTHRQRREQNARFTARRHRSHGSLLVAAALAAASLGAIAQPAAPLTRAEVTAELQRARASGEIERSKPESFGLPQPLERQRGETARPAPAAAGSDGFTREQVRAELIRARAAGEMDYASAEVNAPQPAAARSSSFAARGR